MTNRHDSQISSHSNSNETSPRARRWRPVRAASRLASTGLALALIGASPVLANAVYDSDLRAPACRQSGSFCDSTNLLERSGPVFPAELHHPNTFDGCADGRANSYQVDESIERIVVSNPSGGPITAEQGFRIDVTFYAYGDGSNDLLEIFYTEKGETPGSIETHSIAKIQPTRGGLQTFSMVETALPAATLHRIRARISDQSHALKCDGSGYYDVDELVFAVAPKPTGNTKLKTDSERSVANKSIVACYAELAGLAYEDPIVATDACEGETVGTSPMDDRNDMGIWKLSSFQSASYRGVIRFWERSNGNGHKEVALALTGSRSTFPGGIGDWLGRDAQSATDPSQSPHDNAISSLSSAPSIEIVGSPKFSAGFHDRAQNLANDIHLFLTTRLDNWQAAQSGRRIGVKVTGHSLGAATATIVGLYVADRYRTNPHATVEVFAFNSPKVANADMADTYRKAATNCWFNLHVFNNARDVVSLAPLGAHQIIEEDDDGQDFGQLSCAHQPAYSSHPAISGLHIPRPFNAFFTSTSVDFVSEYLDQMHDWKQWTLPTPSGSLRTLKQAPVSVASRWLPLSELGGRIYDVGEISDEIVGQFKAHLYSHNSQTYLTAFNGGGQSVDAYATSVGASDLFELIPGDTDCIRYGSSIVLKTSSGHYLRAGGSGALNATATELSEATVFTVRITPQTDGCITEGDFLDLRSYHGGFVSAETPHATSSGSSSDSTITFELRNVQDVTPIQ